MHRPALTRMIVTGVFVSFTAIASGQYYYLASELFSPSPAMDEDFGIGLAMNDEYIAVSSYQDDVSFYHDGRVYLYSATTGSYIRTIVGPNPLVNGAFGCSIALDGDLMLVGSFTDQNTSAAGGAGYLYNANTGVLLSHFTAETGDVSDQNGWSVAMQQPLALLGAPGNDDNGDDTGAVQAFLTNLLFQLTTIYADVPIVGERFGTSVAIDGDYIVVGAPGSSTSGSLTGSVYVFDVNSGAQLHRIVPAGAGGGDFVGASVDIDNGVIAIGAPYYDRPGMGGSGIVYTYNVASGTLIDTFNPPMPSVLQQFGTSVALDGDRLVVGSSYLYSNTPFPGSVFIFENDTVEEVITFPLPDGQIFGRRVAAYNGRTAASGSGLGDIEGYVALIERFCDADINADGTRDFFDVSAFIKFAIDYNGDGVFDFFDVSAFLSDFNSDCS